MDLLRSGRRPCAPPEEAGTDDRLTGIFGGRGGYFSARAGLGPEGYVLQCPRMASTDLNGLSCKIQSVVPSFAGHPVLSLLLVTAS
jgi:hypothetical protein